MNTLRRLGLTLSVLLFSLAISTFAAIVSIYFVFENPDNLKQALNSSGIYSTVAKNVLSEQASAASSELPINDPTVQSSLDKALPPQYIQSSSEQAIDGIYKWVKGETASPEFSIDLAPVKSSFTNNLLASVQQKLATLPQCTQYSASPTSLQEVLDLSCLPRGVTAETINENMKREIDGNALFADTPAITGSTLKDSQGQPITDSLAILPALHTYFIVLLYVLPVVAALLAVAIIFLSETKRAGAKKLAWTLISTGLTAVVFALLGVWALQAGTSLLASDTPGIQDKLLAVFAVLAVDLRTWWIGIGAGYTIAGIVILITLRFTRPEPTLAMGTPTQTPPIVPPMPPSEPINQNTTPHLQ